MLSFIANQERKRYFDMPYYSFYPLMDQKMANALHLITVFAPLHSTQLSSASFPLVDYYKEEEELSNSIYIGTFL